MAQAARGPVTFDGKSFKIGGRRVWLHSGEIHYFRFPHELWRETLLRAARAGLNTISTYVPWNFHEPVEGRVSFDGDADLGAYLDMIADLGLLAVVRPGPYICSEWEHGGLPSWLYTKPGLRMRDDNPAFMQCVDRWFDILMPLVAGRQVTRGGPVVLVQNENEYHGGWNESTRSYVHKVSRAFRRNGIEVPIIGCNAHPHSRTEVQVNYSTDAADQMLEPDLIVTYNCGLDVAPIHRLREKQPGAPLFVTEFWSGSQVFWGRSTPPWPDLDAQARTVLEFASAGAQITYYMFDGGTNFGYWAARNFATSYESAYPVAEGGRLRERYYRLKPVNHFMTQFGDFLSDSDEVEGQGGVEAPEGMRCVVRRAPQGGMIFLSSEAPISEASVRLPGGRRLDVALPAFRAAVLPLGLEVLPGVVLDYANLTPLGRDEARRAVVLWGPAGTGGVLSVNGREHVVPVRRDHVSRVDAGGGAAVYIVDQAMAERTWFLDDGITFGPHYVGERRGDGSYEMTCGPGVERVLSAGAGGRLVEGHAAAPAACAALPPLGPWQGVACPEAGGAGEGWRELDEPRFHALLGVDRGYVWYRAEVESDADALLPLHLPMTANRVLAFANGQYCGTWGRARWTRQGSYGGPGDAADECVDVPLARGLNRLAFLSDNLGRKCHGTFDPQGIQGPVSLGGRRMAPEGATDVPPAPVPPEAFTLLYSRDYRRPDPLPGVEFSVRLRPDEAGYLFVPFYTTGFAVSINGRYTPPVPLTEDTELYARPWNAVVLPAGRDLRVRVQYFGVARHVLLNGLQVYAASRALLPRRWAFKALDENADFAAGARTAAASGRPGDGPVLLTPDSPAPGGEGRCAPAFFRTTFPMPDGAGPVFLTMGGMHKGQIHLNGRNAGRFWQVGETQQRYYLPHPWMQAENRLVIFEEFGSLPEGLALAR